MFKTWAASDEDPESLAQTVEAYPNDSGSPRGSDRQPGEDIVEQAQV